MLIKDGYHLGMIGTAYYIWNEKKVIYLAAKNLQNAIKEAKQIL